VQRRRRHVGGVVAQKPLLERTSALQVTFLRESTSLAA
jgi:hypothetical protein